MLRPKLSVVAAATAIMAATSPAAYAYVSDVQVYYYSYDGGAIGTEASAANPIFNNGATIGSADASFFYTGPVDWVYNGSQSGPNIVSTFLNLADVTGFSSPSGKFGSLAAFGSSTLSVAGDASSAFFAIYGAGNFGSVSISHDDGASMYVDSFSNAVISSPGETALITSTGAAAPGFHNYVVTYVEGNGAPSVLQVSVPEPSTWAMMVAGFAGLGLAGYRRNKAASRAV